MAATSGANASLVRKNLLKAALMGGEGKRYNVHKKLTNGATLSTKQAYEQSALVSPVGLPSARNETESAPQSEFTTPYTKTHTPVKQLLQVRISGEVHRHEQYGIARGIGRQMNYSFYKAREINAAKFMNYATNSALLSVPSGQPYWSTAHPNETGTDANRFTTALTLGQSALEQACQNMMGLKDHKGNVDPIPGPFKLEVAPSNAMLADRLVTSKMRPQSADNDVNPLVGMITEVVVGPWFTNSGYWCIHTSGEENKRFCLEEYGLTFSDMEYDQDNDTYKITARESYLYDVFDYRDVWGSPAS